MIIMTQMKKKWHCRNDCIPACAYFSICICMVKNEGKGWGKEAVAAFGSSALALISLYLLLLIQ